MKRFLFGGLLSFGLCWCGSALGVQDGQDAPPDVNTVDAFGVNVATGQVTASLSTVSIGGKMGLSHSISGQTNNFSHTGSYGYLDKFAGSARYIEIGKGLTVDGATLPPTTYVYVMRVFGPVGSEDFKVMSNGAFVPDAHGMSSGFSYEALGDTRHALEISSDGDYLLWTTSDGTVLKYLRSATHDADSNGALRKITYPNGFTVTVYTSDGVTTNTGFQLKYEYQSFGRTLSPEKQNLYAVLPSTNQIPFPDGWGKNPRYIRGVNNAVEYCPADPGDDCDLANSPYDWPKATFSWPSGMPRAIYLGTTVFSVEDAEGGLTEYHFEAQDVCLAHLDDPDSCTGVPWAKGERWSPRLVGIKTARSTAIDRTYTYRNKFEKLGISDWGMEQTEVGEMVSASGPEGRASYPSPSLANPEDYVRSSNWVEKGEFYSVQVSGRYPGSLKKATTSKGGVFFFENNFRNFLTGIIPVSGPVKGYAYDSRSNLSRVTENGITVYQADFPDACSNRKTCNKPTWVKDALGNETDFTYDPVSGQVATATGPPDANSVRPQTRYTYTPLYAYYKKDSDAIERADSPVYLLTREAKCRKTTGSSNGCSGGSTDEVITEYDYGLQQPGTPNNLLLRGTRITAEGESGIETLTTCYEYDIYGNRIGTTLPRAGLTTCP